MVGLTCNGVSVHVVDEVDVRQDGNGDPLRPGDAVGTRFLRVEDLGVPARAAGNEDGLELFARRVRPELDLVPML